MMEAQLNCEEEHPCPDMSEGKSRSSGASQWRKVARGQSFQGTSRKEQDKPSHLTSSQLKQVRVARGQSFQGTSREKQGKPPPTALSKRRQESKQRLPQSEDSEEQGKPPQTALSKWKQVVKQRTSQNEDSEEQGKPPQTALSKRRQESKKRSSQNEDSDEQGKPPQTALSKWKQMVKQRSSQNEDSEEQGKPPQTALSKWKQVVKQRLPQSENNEEQGKSPQTALSKWKQSNQTPALCDSQTSSKTRRLNKMKVFVVPMAPKSHAKDAVPTSPASQTSKFTFANIVGLLTKQNENTASALDAVTKRIRNEPSTSSSLQATKTESCRTKKLIRDLVMPGQPIVSYDILPTSIKNPSFLVRLDLAEPRSRLVIVHREQRNDFTDLNESELHDLVQVVFDLSKKLNMKHLTLRIPIHCRCKKEFRRPFHAFVTVPIIEEFIKYFHVTVGVVPFWPSSSWRTPNWPQLKVNEALSICYERGVREHQSRDDCPETWFRQKNLDSGGECDAFTMIAHTDQPLIGFVRRKDLGGDAPSGDRVLELQTLMSHMYQVAADNEHFFSAMCISVTGAYRAADGWSRAILGFLDYTDTAIPEKLLAQTGILSEDRSGVIKRYSSFNDQGKNRERTTEVLDKWKSTRRIEQPHRYRRTPSGGEPQSTRMSKTAMTKRQ